MLSLNDGVAGEAHKTGHYVAQAWQGVVGLNQGLGQRAQSACLVKMAQPG